VWRDEPDGALSYRYMAWPSHRRVRGAFTLLELLCVIAIITVLASLVTGSAVKVLQRARADQWSDRASGLLHSTVEQLHQRLQARQDFPLVTVDRIETEAWLKPAEIRFLKEPEVTFVPFSGSDPDDKVVIRVELRRGFLTQSGALTQTKGWITRVPE